MSGDEYHTVYSKSTSRTYKPDGQQWLVGEERVFERDARGDAPRETLTLSRTIGDTRLVAVRERNSASGAELPASERLERIPEHGAARDSARFASTTEFDAAWQQLAHQHLQQREPQARLT